MLLNRARAGEILAREQLDGLIAQVPINQYYLSDYWGLFNTPVGYEAAYFSVLPRREAEPAALVLPALEVRRLATTGGTWMPNIFPFSAAGVDAMFADDTPQGVDYVGWPVADDTELGPLELDWVALVSDLGSRMSPDAFWALARAVKAGGLAHGRVAVDDARIAGWLNRCGLEELECVYAPQLFNEIRLVKTESELALLRKAARINEQGLLAAVEALREGATWQDLENVYLGSMALQGGRGVYLNCGVGGLPGGRIRRGEPVMFDALGQYRGYHGDFGRCAVLGEPSVKHLQRHAAICQGWEVAQEYLRPGVRYSQLAAAVGEAVRGTGFAEFRDPVVHSLGLEHTDDPKPPGVQPQTKPDQTLQAGMVVNVDMPHTEIGWGSVHMEDTVVITDNGCERLASADFDLRVVEQPVIRTV